MKIVKKNTLKIGIFTAVKNRCILHGRVFVMSSKALVTRMLQLLCNHLATKKIQNLKQAVNVAESSSLFKVYNVCHSDCIV